MTVIVLGLSVETELNGNGSSLSERSDALIDLEALASPLRPAIRRPLADVGLQAEAIEAIGISKVETKAPLTPGARAWVQREPHDASPTSTT